MHTEQEKGNLDFYKETTKKYSHSMCQNTLGVRAASIKHKYYANLIKHVFLAEAQIWRVLKKFNA